MKKAPTFIFLLYNNLSLLILYYNCKCKFVCNAFKPKSLNRLLWNFVHVFQMVLERTCDTYFKKIYFYDKKVYLKQTLSRSFHTFLSVDSENNLKSKLKDRHPEFSYNFLIVTDLT